MHLQKNETSSSSLTLIKDLSVRPSTLKLLDKDITETLQDIGVGKGFLERTPNTTENNQNN